MPVHFLAFNPLRPSLHSLCLFLYVVCKKNMLFIHRTLLSRINCIILFVVCNGQNNMKIVFNDRFWRYRRAGPFFHYKLYSDNKHCYFSRFSKPNYGAQLVKKNYSSTSIITNLLSCNIEFILRCMFSSCSYIFMYSSVCKTFAHRMI